MPNSAAFSAPGDRPLPLARSARLVKRRVRWALLAPLFASLIIIVAVHSDATYLGELKPRGDGGSLLRRLTLGATYLWAAIICGRELFYATRLVRRSSVYLLGVGFGLLSMLWSDYPRNILIDAVHALGILLVCTAAAIGTSGSVNRLCRALNVFFLPFLCLCILVSIAVPDLGQLASGRWRGITSHANSLGAMALLATWSATVVLLGSHARVAKAVALGCLALSAICLIGSNSMTSLVLSVFVVAATPVMVTALRRGAVGVVFSGIGVVYLVGVALLGLYVSYPETLSVDYILAGLGRDATLTGRTRIWSEALAAFHERPFLGWSFDGLRTLHSGRYAHLPDQMHSGYVHLLVLGGIVGAGIAALLVTQVTVRCLFMGREHPEAAAALLVALLIFLGHNGTEGSFYRSNHVMWVFLLLLLTHGGPRLSLVGGRLDKTP